MEYEIVPYTEADVDAMIEIWNEVVNDCLLYTSDAADDQAPV